VRVKLWGVRGSIPTPLSTEQLQEKLFQALSGAQGVNLSDPAEVEAYIARLPVSARSIIGGNTTCVEIDTGSETIIIDAGSGIRPLGLSLMAREFGQGQGVAHIFLTHAHWDHLQGFPFFLPAYVPGNKLIFYAVNHNPEDFLNHQQIAPTYFPIPINTMAAEKEFVRLHEGESVRIGRTVVSSLSLYHPGTAYAYRLDDGESIFVFASDGEYKSLTESNLRRYTDFYANADALVFDAQYSLREVFLHKADWGHSSAMIGVDIAERAKVKKLITFHHDPTHSDEQIYTIANSAREYAAINEIQSNTEVIVGMEGMELFLGKPLGLETIEQHTDSVWTLALAGQLNSLTLGEAQSRLRATISSAPGSRVIIDLTLLSATDATGIKGLVDVARAYPTAQIAVLTPSQHIKRALEQSGATETLRLFRSRQQAITALVGPAHLRLAAETIGGQYQLDERLFADDLGVVYLGTELNANTPVIVRVVAGQKDDPVRMRFKTEAEAWRGLQHALCLPCKAIIEHEDWVAYVCARPDGVSLREWRAKWKTKEQVWVDVWRTVEQLCEGVAALHAQHLVHGDLRPENVVVTSSRAQLSRASLFPHAPEHNPNAYRSPEQLRNQPITMRSDVYSLGIVLYELFLDAHPFAAESEELRLTLQLYSQPQSPRLRWPEIPLKLENLLLKMLSINAEERFASGQEVLEAYAAIRPEPLPPPKDTSMLVGFPSD